MVLLCLPSDALLQHLPSYLDFSYLGRGVSLHGCSSKVQPLLLTLDKGYLITAAPPDLERGVAPLSPPAPHSSRSLEVGLLHKSTKINKQLPRRLSIKETSQMYIMVKLLKTSVKEKIL